MSWALTPNLLIHKRNWGGGLSLGAKSLRLEANHTLFNPLTPNDHYNGRTAPLTSKRCILYIYSQI